MSRLFDKRQKQLRIFKEARERLQKSKSPEQSMTQQTIDCPDCGHRASAADLLTRHFVCPQCGKYHPLNSKLRLALLLDPKSFKEMDAPMFTTNPLQFPDYMKKVFAAQEKTGMKDGLLGGEGKIDGQKVAIAVLDSRFMMGSMGGVVGEKLTRLIEMAIRKKLPLVVISASGGARMQEGMIALMQMAKTSQAVGRLHEAGLLYISVLTNPTTGGVTASFASLADIMIAEPKAVIGFAGRRVIEDTVKEQLPDDFQQAEFQLAHGQLDMIVPRDQLRQELAWLLRLHGKGGIL